MKPKIFVEGSGRQYAMQLLTTPPAVVRENAVLNNDLSLFNSAFAMHNTEEIPAFLHSAFCAMSLPTRRPKDEFQPIIRQDGKYSLAITPKPRLVKNSAGIAELVNLGVPFGSYPRVILINILTQAVLQKSRDIYLGGSFQDMMRRFGYEDASRGSRGQTDLLCNQLDRLLACEWMIQWDNDTDGENAFALREVKLSNDYQGTSSADGSTFSRELRMAESFYEHLIEHAVRFDLNAIYALRSKPTAIDLYTYLAFRLNRIPHGKPVTLTYEQLAAHIGNNVDSVTKLRQTIKNALNTVSSVYPDARVELGTKTVKLGHSPSPTGQKLHVVPKAIAKSREQPVAAAAPLATEVTFPTGTLHYEIGDRAEFQRIALEHGRGYDIDVIAAAYRNMLGGDLERMTGRPLLNSFAGFCKKFTPR